MSNNPLVSIIMSTYNNEKTIGECISSILNQTYTHWEFLICNDCSTDDTSRILNNLAKRDKRIKIFSNKANLGLARNLNKCIKYSEGKYIARMDADDISLPTRLEKQIDFLEKNPDIDILGTSMIINDGKTNLGIRKNTKELTRFSFLKGSPFFHPTIVIKRKVLEELGGYSTKVYRTEDLDLWFRLYQKGYTGANLDEALYVYQESLSDLKKRNMKAAISATKVFFNGFNKINIPIHKRLIAFKPIFSCILPNTFVNNYHMKKLTRKE